MAQRALVTGGAGFIGSHVVDSLVRDGFEVLVVDDLSTGDTDRLAQGAALAQLDITESRAVDEAFDDFRPNAVYHLAAQASVTASVVDPGRDCAVNVGGTLNIVEAARRHEAPVVFTSTGGALYGDDAPLPTSEAQLPLPQSPYGASKLAGEAYVRSWTAAHGVPNAVMRLGNIYGPRQTPHGEAGVVAIFSYRLWAGEPCTLFGHGTPTRDYVHVHDVVAALRAASGETGIYNVGTGVETDVATLFARLAEAAGSTAQPALADLRPGELKRSCLDASRARSELGWAPKVAFAEGLASTYEAMVAGFGAAA
ncbi:MAG: UDP-glucose 4-epimerase [Gaiellales bacterium]|nr:UDP-glucose 4-epimerase [Gaiellales bacterium]